MYYSTTMHQAAMNGKLEGREYTSIFSTKIKHVVMSRYTDTYPLSHSFCVITEHTLLLASVSYWFYFQPSMHICKVYCCVGEIECGFLLYLMSAFPV